MLGTRITAWLTRASPAAFASYAIFAAFSTYFCMYAFRKPFAAGTFDGQVEIGGLAMDYKILLVISQVIGYCLSKFIGIKVISEMDPSKRGVAILAVIAAAWASLLLFAFLPRPWGAIALFLNGLPLGMVWGLVFGFLEGRKLSEALGAGLSASYILASGVVKSVGLYTMAWGVPEVWMPFATGAIFFLPFCVVVWLLSRLPPPSAEDEAARTKREPMDGAARVRFLKEFGPGIVALTMLYILLTAYRDFRDTFAVEIWDALGYGESPSVLAWSELPITIGVLGTLAALMAIKDNRKALLIVHAIMAGGTILIGVSTMAWQAGMISPVVWMISVGFGLYIGYVPYGCVLFDRLIAATGFVGTAGFLIYVTDAFGYAGSVALVLYKNFGQAELSWLEFFVGFSYVTFGVCSLAFVVSFTYFARKTRMLAA